MNILMICNKYSKNNKNIGNQFVHAQALALKRCGHDISVLSLDMRSIRKKRKLGIYIEQVDGIEVCCVSLPCGPVPFVFDFICTIASFVGVRKILKKNKVEIIHAHFQFGAYLSLVKKKYHIPIVTTEHASWILDENRTLNKERLALKAYNNSDCVISVSETLKESILSFYDEEVTVIHNVLLEQFKVIHDVKEEEFTFVCVGRLNSDKNQDLLIEAFDLFVKEFPHSKLLIIGTGPSYNLLCEMVKEKGLSDRVLVMGYIDNSLLPGIFNKSHCFVLPSNFETFGVVYIEALACGLPVIANETSKYNGIVTTSNGIALDIINIDSLYNAMRNIYVNYPMYHGEDISKECINKYSELVFVDKVNKVYLDVINKSGGV